MIAYHEPPARDVKAHYLKLDADLMDAVVAGVKTAEFRQNDRDFQVHDYMVLRSDYATVMTVITHAVYGPKYGIPQGYAMLSFHLVDMPPHLIASIADGGFQNV